MEKLGVQKEQLISELQAEYSRLRLQQHELVKTGAASSERAQLSNEMEQIRERISSLQGDK